MAAEAVYCDTSYLVRLYLEDAGHEEVRELVARHRVVACASHGRAEVVAALHRAFRENRLDATRYALLHRQFFIEQDSPGFRWYALDEAVNRRLQHCYRTAPATAFLRTADALHLACAAEQGFTAVYSHDRHFLAAAPLFGLTGRDVIKRTT